MNRSKQKAIRAMTKTKGMSPIELALMHEIAKKAAKKANEDSADEAFILMLALPAMVLADEYWPKSANKKLPEFIDMVLQRYEDWKNGLFSIEDAKQYLKDECKVGVEQ